MRQSLEDSREEYGFVFVSNGVLDAIGKWITGPRAAGFEAEHLESNLVCDGCHKPFYGDSEIERARLNAIEEDFLRIQLVVLCEECQTQRDKDQE